MRYERLKKRLEALRPVRPEKQAFLVSEDDYEEAKKAFDELPEYLRPESIVWLIIWANEDDKTNKWQWREYLKRVKSSM